MGKIDIANSFVKNFYFVLLIVVSLLFGFGMGSNNPGSECENTCYGNHCDGYDFIECEIVSDCWIEVDKGKVIGKCGVECLIDDDCSIDEECNYVICTEINITINDTNNVSNVTNIINLDVQYAYNRINITWEVENGVGCCRTFDCDYERFEEECLEPEFKLYDIEFDGQLINMSEMEFHYVCENVTPWHYFYLENVSFGQHNITVYQKDCVDIVDEETIEVIV